MRVVHLSCVAPPEIGGMGKAALREVAGLRARGIDARLIAPGESGAEKSFVTRIKPIVRWGNGAFMPHLKRDLKDVDVIHLHHPFYGAEEQILSGLYSHAPIVVTFHMDATPTGIRGLGVRLHQWLIQPWLINHAAKVIVSSFDYAQRSSIRDLTSSHTSLFTELPFGIDMDFFSPGIDQRTRFGVPQNAPAVLFVGGLDQAHAFKGLSQLFEAFSFLDSSTHLMIVGDGDLRTNYQEMVHQKKLDRRVHFLGRLDDASVRDAYRSADVFAFPSTTSAEAFGLVLVEAQACGLPVVASALPGVRTVVRSGETGLLVPPKEVDALVAALKQVLEDGAFRQRMREQARVFVQERFSWDKHLDGLEKVYHEVISKR